MNKNDGNYSTEIFQKKPNENSKKSTVLYLIISFLCAVFLWFFVADYDTTVTKTFNGVPIDFLLPDNTEYTIGSVSDSYVNITVSGTKADVNELTNDSFYASVDVKSFEQEYTMDMKLSIEHPHNIEIIEQSITDVEVSVTKNVKKDFPIHTEFIGSWDKTYNLIGQCNPGKITVEGTESVIAQIADCKVLLDVGGIERPKEFRTEVVLVDVEGNEISPSQNHLKLSEKYISVYVKIDLKKDLPLKVVFTGDTFNADTDAIYKIDPQTVQVSGKFSEVSKMEYIPVYIDERNIKDGKFEGVATLPDLSDKEVEYVSAETEVNVNLTLLEKFPCDVELSIDDIKYIGLSDGLAAQMQFISDSTGAVPSNVVVTFYATSEAAIERLRKEGTDLIECIVDFRGLDADLDDNFVNIGVTFNVKDEELKDQIYAENKISVNSVIVKNTAPPVQDSSVDQPTIENSMEP